MTNFTTTVLSNLGVDQFYNLIIFINIDEIFQCLIEIFCVNRTVVARLRFEVELFCVPIQTPHKILIFLWEREIGRLQTRAAHKRHRISKKILRGLTSFYKVILVKRQKLY